MGYRMSLGCTCSEGHYFLELDESFATTVWLDPDRILAELGLATLPSIANAEEEPEEGAEEVEIAPEAFLRWLDAVAARRAEILEALKRKGGHPSGWSEWQEANFATAWSTYRELGEHVAANGEAIDAGWA